MIETRRTYWLETILKHSGRKNKFQDRTIERYRHRGKREEDIHTNDNNHTWLMGNKDDAMLQYHTMESLDNLKFSVKLWIHDFRESEE